MHHLLLHQPPLCIMLPSFLPTPVGATTGWRNCWIVPYLLLTVGVNKKWTLVFVNFSAQDASILKISVPIIKRRSWGFQNTPNLQILHDFKPSYGNLKELKMSKNNFDWRFREGKSKHCFFGCAITWLKIMQILQVGGVLESSGPPLDDGHRDF